MNKSEVIEVARHHIQESEPEFIQNVSKDLNIPLDKVSIDTIKLTNHEKGIIEIKHYIKVDDVDITISGHTVIVKPPYVKE